MGLQKAINSFKRALRRDLFAKSRYTFKKHRNRLNNIKYV